MRAGTTIRTAIAPPDHTPLVRGPQNLRATATHDTITVSWDHPWPDTEDDYWLGISSPTVSVPIRHINARVFPPASQYTYTDLDPSSTYRIVVMHNDIVRAGAAITITTNRGAARRRHGRGPRDRRTSRRAIGAGVATPHPFCPGLASACVLFDR